MTTPSAAYTAAITAVAGFDRSTAGTISLIGPDAVQFLHNLCSNDVKSLPVGGGCEAYLCDPRAKVQQQFWVSRVADGIWLETVPGRDPSLFQALDRYLISERIELTNSTNDSVQYHVAGPKAKSALEAVTGVSLDLPEFHHVFHEGDRIRRRMVLGVDGYDIVCPKARATAWRPRLEQAGVVFGNEADFETLRIEAGSPEMGKDIDENRFVMEVAHAPRAVSYAKGCFPGQEPIVMARDRAGFINRAFLGVKVLSGGPIAFGTKLTRDGQDVGVITSSIDSPRLGAPVALGYIKRGHQEPGTKLDANGQSVEVLGMPPIKSV
ncbi:MAG: glycine cleavage T C-terminal barrel domain-containing protein [Gemmataceae bacterium]